jgi:hypothetical protein
MPKPWRIAAIAATVCGLTAATAATAGPALATQAAPTVSINVSSPIGKITNDVLVAFEDGKFSVATISGSVSGATSGEVAALYAQPFPFKSAPAAVAGQTTTLTGAASQAYSFSASPSVATKYTVEVLPSSTSTTAAVVSAAKIVYVVTNQTVTGGGACARPECHLTFKVTTELPASAYKTEAAKKWYFYFGVKFSATGKPAPKFLYLTKATISKAKKVSSTAFERTITYSFRVGDHGYHWEINFCSKDTESKDGINLPGHHSCGDKKISAKTIYLG